MGLGEVLWDLFPGRACLGGAPANFAYITTLMGDHAKLEVRIRNAEVGINADFRFQIADFRFWGGVPYTLRACEVFNLQSKISNLKSSICNRHHTSVTSIPACFNTRRSDLGAARSVITS